MSIYWNDDLPAITLQVDGPPLSTPLMEFPVRAGTRYLVDCRFDAMLSRNKEHPAGVYYSLTTTEDIDPPVDGCLYNSDNAEAWVCGTMSNGFIARRDGTCKVNLVTQARDLAGLGTLKQLFVSARSDV